MKKCLATGMILLILMALIIVCLMSINDLDKKQRILTQEIKKNEIIINHLGQENLELKAKIQKLKAYDEISKKEFLQTWKSFGNIRNNFKALGLGYHLCPGDITPESEID